MSATVAATGAITLLRAAGFACTIPYATTVRGKLPCFNAAVWTNTLVAALGASPPSSAASAAYGRQAGADGHYQSESFHGVFESG